MDCLNRVNYDLRMGWLSVLMHKIKIINNKASNKQITSGFHGKVYGVMLIKYWTTYCQAKKTIVNDATEYQLLKVLP